MHTTSAGSEARGYFATRRRWQVALLLSLITAIGSIDRQAMAVTAARLKEAFGLDAAHYGQLGFAFLGAYAIGQLLSGPFVARLGTRRALAWAAALWSLAAMGHALAAGFLGLFVARALLGLTEGPNYPTAMRAVAEWFPRAERSLAAGWVSAGTGLGLILAPPLAGGLAAAFGWQAAFLVPGAFGLLWVVYWWRFYRLPEHFPNLSPAERAIALADRYERPVAAEDGTNGAVTLRSQWQAWRRHLHRRETWGLILSRFVGDGAYYFFAFWLPLYLQTERGFSPVYVVWAAVVPFLFADLGSLAGGWAGQKLIQRGWSVDRSRKTMIWAGSLGALVAFPAASVDSWVLALVLVSLAIGSIQWKTASNFPLAADLYPASDVAAVWGLSGAAGSLGGALFQLGVGALVMQFGYPAAFGVASSLCIFQALIITLMIPKVEPLK
ncbi:MAG: MFS transporter [Gammaproteobacteria bacterium]